MRTDLHGPLHVISRDAHGMRLDEWGEGEGEHDVSVGGRRERSAKGRSVKLVDVVRLAVGAKQTEELKIDTQ